jgi:hypothetical protein
MEQLWIACRVLKKRSDHIVAQSPTLNWLRTVNKPFMNQTKVASVVPHVLRVLLGIFEKRADYNPYTGREEQSQQPQGNNVNVNYNSMLPAQQQQGAYNPYTGNYGGGGARGFGQQQQPARSQPYDVKSMFNRAEDPTNPHGPFEMK